MKKFKLLDEMILYNKEKDMCVSYFYQRTDFFNDILVFTSEDGKTCEFTREYLYNTLI